MGVDDAIFFGTDEDMENALVTQTVGRSSADHNMEDLRSVAFAHLRHV